METLDPVEHDVVEGRVADLATAAAPVDVGVAAVISKMSPASFGYVRQVGAERRAEAQSVACFELGANQFVYASAPSAPSRAQDAYRQERPASFRPLQHKQREVIWQLRSDASP
jgi:hypothetical protein